MNTLVTKFGKVNYPDYVTSSNGVVKARLWEKDDMCRVYFSVLFRSGKVDCGYYDVANNKSFMSSRPVNIARAIEADITLTTQN